MKKRTLLIGLTTVLLLLSVALLLVACGSIKGTYYEVNGDKLNESSWIKLSGGKWTDDEDASGTYKTSGNNRIIIKHSILLWTSSFLRTKGGVLWINQLQFHSAMQRPPGF